MPLRKIDTAMKDIAPAISSPSGIGDSKPTNQAVLDWVQEVSALTQPENTFWCDGSEGENEFLLDQACRQDVLIKLNDRKVPRSYLHRSNPNDVARVEQFTFICTPTRDEAGPTNNWSDPAEMHTKLQALLKGAMRGRTMFVIPYIMGPPDSALTKVGFEITDSIYVVLSMRIMTRMGTVAIKRLGDNPKAEWNRGVHSLLDVDPARRFISHFPQDNAIISGYGGNVLLSKKCLALRIGSYLARKQGWLAEHMLILGVESPEGRKHYVAAAFPSACGKTNFAMLIPPPHFKGWKVTTVGDDIAWMQIRDGRLYAVNPENGYFGVVPGTSYKSNPNAMKSIEHDTLYTNVALTDDGEVWWEGKGGPPPAHLIDWRGNDWTPDSKEKAAHPNSRFETTAAAAGAVGKVRRDPMAMLPFCGYNIGDYFRHWLATGKRLTNPPLIFNVNWFRKGVDGKFLWPGFGDNMRVLKWIIDRCEGSDAAVKSPIGWLPRPGDLDLDELDVQHKCIVEILGVDHEEWRREVAEHEKFFNSLGGVVPDELLRQRQNLEERFKG